MQSNEWNYTTCITSGAATSTSCTSFVKQGTYNARYYMLAIAQAQEHNDTYNNT